MAPAVRRVFEVRPSREERTRWSSLTVHQLEALVALQQGSLTMGKLCEHLDISESAGTALSDRLVARGWWCERWTFPTAESYGCRSAKKPGRWWTVSNRSSASELPKSLPESTTRTL